MTIKVFAGGGVERSEHFSIDDIPARRSFVIADRAPVADVPRLARVVAHLRVQQMLRRASEDKLATVSQIQIERSNDRVKAVITNPYPFPVNLTGWRAYAVLYNAAGAGLALAAP